jgi:hypothetical protein
MLTPPQFRSFHKALLQAFIPQELQRMMRFRLGKNILDYTNLAQPQTQIFFEVIDAAERGGWTDRLILAAREELPDNPYLLVFAEEFGLAPKIEITSEGYTPTLGYNPSSAQLEKTVRGANYAGDIAVWREHLGKIEGQVCAVEINNQHVGTGFIVAPDVIMTNYHVVEYAIQGKVKPSQVMFRFDYKRLADGRTINSGVLYPLAADDTWIIDWSPYNPTLDFGTGMSFDGQKLDELDYALLRCADPIGELPVGGDRGDLKANPRGWIQLSPSHHDFATNPALYIAQYPNGQPLKLALDTESFIGLNQNATRVRYRTNTEPGSSGSPIFNYDWVPVALHHSGDPAKTQAKWNQGIPMEKILDLLRPRNILSLVCP